MIDRQAFHRAWEHICARFGRDPDPRQEAAYFEFLSAQMDTEEFTAAARAVWATAKWFPRPADFLFLASTTDWRHVLAAVEACVSPSFDWFPHFERVSKIGQDACRSLGGIPTMRTIWERDILRLKKAWEEAVEAEAANAVVTGPALGKGPGRPVVMPANPQRRVAGG